MLRGLAITIQQQNKIYEGKMDWIILSSNADFHNCMQKYNPMYLQRDRRVMKRDSNTIA